MRRFIVRILIICISVFAGLAVVELGLQIAGVYVRRNAMARLLAPPGDSRPLVAFCGDSNIYGLYIHQDNATLSKQVEALSQKKSPGGTAAGVRTVNFGLPASASWAVLEQVKRALELKPAAIIVRTGINNIWQYPPEGAAGFLENLKLVRMFRLSSANQQLGDAHSVTFGPGGHAVANAARDAGGGQSEILLKTRDGLEMPFQIMRAGANVMFEKAEPRLRADLDEMARLAEAASVTLIFATYLDPSAPACRAIRNVILTFDGARGARVADCAPYAELAIAGPANDAIPGSALATARRSLLLTRDGHPTSVGYAVEARVVAGVLAEAGILKDYQYESPAALIQQMELYIPKLQKKPGFPGVYDVRGHSGDRVYLIAGLPGESYYRETLIPIDCKSLSQGPLQIKPPVAPIVELREPGIGELKLDPAAAKRLPENAQLIAVIERGGVFGGARILISNAVEYQKTAK
ncbi:MAG: hypothetical protein ACKVS6_02690 [Planctomycetota bacterium]